MPNVDDEDGVTLPATFVACGSRQRHGQRLGGGEARRLDRLERRRQLRRRRREDLRQPGRRGGPQRPARHRALHRDADDEELRPLPHLDGGRPCCPPAWRPTARSRTTPSVLRGLDFGDAPARLPDVARRQRRPPSWSPAPVRSWASLVDTEPNGQPTARSQRRRPRPAIDDEDGVVFTSPLIRGQNATVTVTASRSGRAPGLARLRRRRQLHDCR